VSNFFPPAERDGDEAQPTQVIDRQADADELDYDDEFAPQPRQKLGRLSAVLAAVLVLGLGFLGGILVQKHTGTSSTRATTFGAGTGAGGAAGARAAFGAGGAGRAGGFGGGGATATGNAGAGTAGGGAPTGGAATSTLAVVGQIVSVKDDTVVVKNLGGKDVTVHLSGDTKITVTITAASLKAGQSVAVSGRTGADGSVTATSVAGQ
jgi:hypothetical protein